MRANIIYGPSGSGKSTLAFMAHEINKGSVQIERDIIRFKVLKLGDWETYHFNQRTENLVDAYWKHYIIDAHDWGQDIIVSDTLCSKKIRNKAIMLLQDLGYKVNLHQMQTPLEECIKRDAKRGKMSVGEDVIRKQWERINS